MGSPDWLCWVLGSYMLTQHDLGLILKILDLMWVL